MHMCVCLCLCVVVYVPLPNTQLGSLALQGEGLASQSVYSGFYMEHPRKELFWDYRGSMIVIGEKKQAVKSETSLSSVLSSFEPQPPSISLALWRERERGRICVCCCLCV